MHAPRSLRPVSLTLTLAAALLGPPPAAAQVIQERVDLSVAQRIRDEGLTRSRIDSLSQYLFDLIGPRLTGSGGMRRANDWTAQVFRDWGLANVKVEPWGRFGRGWERVSYSGRMLEPYVQPLNEQPLAWSGSTRGPVTGPVVLIMVTDSSQLAQYRGKVRGAWVLRDSARTIPPEFDPAPLRTPLERLFDTTRQQPFQQNPDQRARMQAQQALNRLVYDFLRAEKAAGIISASNRTYGILSPQGGPFSQVVRDSARFDPLPAVVIGHEQYSQIYRLVKRGVPVRLEISAQNRWITTDSMAYNTLAEIPGGDLKDQVVMLGAHLDSWFGSQGATDNGAGTVVMMEAMRILKTLGVAPRRTVRIALWSGEELGLLGSRAWVKNHSDELPKISAYVNVDNGTGRLRGIWDQSNEAVIPIFRQILSPFQDLGVVAVRHGNTGGTDHLAFDAVGVPGFNYIQDPIEYGTRTHHTDVDSYERLVMDDLRQAAVVVAYTVYHLAMRDEMMPRKPAPAQTGAN
ncbi:MAG TPA: M20/M25/M40 family metallo-hydrolase [Gemmatimonadales bacterium]